MTAILALGNEGEITNVQCAMGLNEEREIT